MTKTILITGAGSGLGEGAAIGLAKEGHDVIAGVQISPRYDYINKPDGTQEAKLAASGTGTRQLRRYQPSSPSTPPFSFPFAGLQYWL